MEEKASQQPAISTSVSTVVSLALAQSASQHRAGDLPIRSLPIAAEEEPWIKAHS